MFEEWIVHRMPQAELLTPELRDSLTGNGVCTGLCLQVAGMVFDGTFRPSKFPEDLAIRFECAVRKHRIYKTESRVIVATDQDVRYADLIWALREHFAIDANNVCNGSKLSDLARALAAGDSGVYSLALIFDPKGGHSILFLKSNQAVFVYDPAVGLLLLRGTDLMTIAKYLAALRDWLSDSQGRTIERFDLARWQRQVSEERQVA